MFQRIRRFVAIAVIAATPAITVLTPNTALAAACSWSGAGDGSTFADGANWNAGCLGAGGAPGAGDVVTINNVSGTMLYLSDDLSGVSLGGIVFTGTKQVQINIVSGQTFTGDITSTNTDSVPSSMYGPIVLGANVTATNVDLRGSSDTLTMGGNTLTFKTNTSYTSIGIGQIITGTGTLNIDAGTNPVSFEGANTFSGTTNIVSAGDITNLAQDSTTIFGTSAIVVSSDATLPIHAQSSFTFANAVTFQQASVNAGVYSNQLVVYNESGTSTPVNVALSNITLLGSSRFTINNTSPEVLSVNLAGITANSHCVQYGDAANTDAAVWQNGPAGCVAAATTTNNTTTTPPAAPDTGFALVSAHPGTTMAITLAAVAALLAAARMTRSSSRR